MATKTITINGAGSSGALHTSGGGLYVISGSDSRVKDSATYVEPQFNGDMLLRCVYDNSSGNNALFHKVKGHIKMQLIDKDDNVVKEISKPLDEGIGNRSFGINLWANPLTAAGENLGAQLDASRPSIIHWYVDQATFATGKVKIQISGRLSGDTAATDAEWLSFFGFSDAMPGDPYQCRVTASGNGVMEYEIPFTVVEA